MSEINPYATEMTSTCNECKMEVVIPLTQLLVDPFGSEVYFIGSDADKNLRFFHRTCTNEHKVTEILSQIEAGIVLTGELL